jgi:hypothetical protein
MSIRTKFGFAFLYAILIVTAIYTSTIVVLDIINNNY